MPKVLSIDQTPGEISFGNTTETGANTFTRDQVPDDIIAPDIVVDKKIFDGGGLTIEEVLAWDIYAWEPMTDARPDISAAQDTVQEFNAGLTKDNSVLGDDVPTADSLVQETRPGSGAGSTNVRYVRRWTWPYGANQEVTAASQVNRMHVPAQKFEMNQMTILPPGPRSYYLPLLAAHYHRWAEGFNLNGASTFSLGAVARRIQVEFDELMFDRESLLGILGFVTNIIV